MAQTKYEDLLGKRSTILLNTIGYKNMTVYPSVGNDPKMNSVVFDYKDQDLLFFIRNNLVVETRFLKNFQEEIYGLKIGMNKSEVIEALGEANKIIPASDIGFNEPFDQVFTYNDFKKFDFVFEAMFDADGISIQFNIYP